MKRYLTVCVSAALLFAALTACQPTPTSEIVRSKDGTLAPAMIFEMAPNFSLSEMLAEVPEHWQDALSLRNGSVQINIDVGIEYPDVAAIPIVSISPARLDLEKVQQLIKFFAGEGMSIAVPPQDSSGSIVPSREDIEGFIVSIGENIKAILENNAGSITEEIKAHIQELEEERKQFTEALATHVDTPMQIIESCVELQGKTGVMVYVYNAQNEKITEIRIGPRGGARDDIREGVAYTEKEVLMPEGYAVKTQNDALQFGNAALQAMQLEDAYGLVSARESEGVYILHYGRTYKGITHTPLVNHQLVFESQYKAAWVDERLRIQIDAETNKFTFHWWGYGALGDELTSNAELCSFAEIQKSCNNYLRSVFSYRAEEIATTVVDIDRVSLGYVRVAQQNSGGYMLIPAWTFQGSIKNSSREGYGYITEGLFEEYPNDRVVLILSAIDGAMVYSGTANGG